MTGKDIAVEVASEPRLLTAVRGLIRGYLDQLDFPKERAEEAVLAVDEACTNSIRHSYRGDPHQPLRLTLRTTEGWIEIVLTDSGAPAPAESVCRKETVAPDPQAVEPGGLGVQLIYSVFDEVTFRPGKTKGNRVTMRLKRPPQEPGTAR